MDGHIALDAVVNWIWQGVVVALAAAAILRTRRISATTRCRSWWIALAIVLLIPLVRFAMTASGAPTGSPAPTASAPELVGGFSVVLPEPSWTWPLTIALCAAWCAVHLWRTAAALVALRRTKRSCLPFPEERSTALSGWTSLRGSGRRARLALSRDVGTAAVLGLTSPVIAVSPAILGALTDDELDRIVVHEWAHVQRRDDWGRLVQLIIRAVAGFHPAVWWIDRQLHLERETACDDWAVKFTGSPRTYAACLTKVAALSTRSADPALLPCVLTSSDLVRRVMRLLDGRRSTSTRPRLATAAIVSPVLGLTALAVASVELVVSATPVVTVASVSSAIVSTAAADAKDAEPVPAPVVRTVATGSAPRRELAQPPAVDATEDRRQDTEDRRQKARDRSEKTEPSAAPESSATIPPIPVRSSFANAVEIPGTLTTVASSPSPSLPGAEASTPASKAPTPWGAAADAGVGIGRGSQKAAVATAGFFTKLSKSITRSF